MSVPPLVSRGTEAGYAHDDARRGISCGARASACEVSGAYPPFPSYPAVAMTSPGSSPSGRIPLSSPFLFEKQGERGERYGKSLKIKRKARTPTGGTGGGTGGTGARLRMGVPPVPPPRTPHNPSRVRGADKNRCAAIARCPIRSLRASPRLLAPPRAFLSDSGPLASRVASSPSPAPLFGAHNRASFGCDNPAACESAPSVRSGGVVGDVGVGEKVGDMRADHPLHPRGGPEIRTTRSLGVCTL
jgi:hypothetical protein